MPRFYELAVLGSPTAEQRDVLTNTIGEMVREFGLSVGDDIAIYDASSMVDRDRYAAFAVAYFGDLEHVDVEAVHTALNDSAPVIPVLGPTDSFTTNMPDVLQSSNGIRLREDDPEMSELAVALLECVGLLRQQRRVFVSYRREDSRVAAVQLHDLLSARGFDVFLDTHDIRPGDPFQDVLWHRLVDSDVMIMLDTPTYFDSRWTRQEIGRARAKEIQVLRVVWPEHSPSRLTDLSETVYLTREDLDHAHGPLRSDTADAIVLKVERLRSRSIAARYMSITGKLRADVEKIGGIVEGVGAHRAIALRLLNNRQLWAYPVVGIPTAETLNDVAETAQHANQQETPVIVYDHLGIRDRWNAHLKWLDEHIKAVRAIRVSDAGWILAGWEQ